MARYHGKGGVVYLSITGTGAATVILALNKWSLSMAADKSDASAFDDTNKRAVQGLPDISGGISGWWDDTDDNLYDASRSNDGCKLYLYPSKLTTAKYFYGPAWIDFTIDTGVDGPVATKGDFVANGAWGQF